ncbi:hypothetical protein Asi03nite_42610 [Actinoplanes siamensis]|uniref:Uncharacterized protein n=1 Tax=Actinoplanes siamensis TaxID=1223317 RepID=A0A919N995_9ACTN|nr:hypothetical protein Asi03nite_42610 [Actinoplanes siamensis]
MITPPVVPGAGKVARSPENFERAGRGCTTAATREKMIEKYEKARSEDRAFRYMG